MADSKLRIGEALRYLVVGLLVVAGCSQSKVAPQPAAKEAAASGEGHSQVTQALDSTPKPAFYTVGHYDPKRNPMEDLVQTIARAKSENKNILVQVGGDWCGWCKLMSTYIETNDKVRDNILENYLVMKVTKDQENPNESFLSQYPEIHGYPHIFVLDSNGKVLHSQNTAELEEGHGYNETVYLDFLNKWKPLR